MRYVSNFIGVVAIAALANLTACTDTTGDGGGAGINADVVIGPAGDVGDAPRIPCVTDETCRVDVEELGECETATCVAGFCEVSALEDGTVCADGFKCTGPDACVAGTCRGDLLSCDDGNPCTTDKCDPKTGCFQSPLEGDACDDGNVCTLDDSCTAGACVPGALIAGCCVHNGQCEDGDVCTDDQCDGGVCVFNPNFAPCDDNNPCTGPDTCDGAGGCGGVEIECEDGSPCTADSCDVNTGTCVSAPAPDGTPCDDANPCTTVDICQGGGCAGTNDTCVCTTDADCVPFEDASLCNGTLICTGFTCVVDLNTIVTCPSTPFPCAPNACDPGSGQCVPSPLPDGTPCDDAAPCTGNDVCTGGVCQGTNLSCDDANPCTVDACDPTSGCQNQPTTAACDDGDSCTVGDSCAAGACVSGAAVVCDDANPCTDDLCTPATGACSTSPNSAPCDDGNSCTLGDQCGGGVCLGGANTCECVTDADCAVQEDGDLCNGTLRCVANSCEVDQTTVITCDTSGDPVCQANTCQSATGLCALTPVADGTACADNDLCDGTETCTNGACGAGTPLDCDDGNECTTDACSASDGCGNTPVTNGTTCASDGDDCTEDACAAGVCVHTYNCSGQPPTVTCGADIAAEPLDTVSLSGTGSDPDGGNVAFLWTVTTAPTGSTSQPANPSSANTNFFVDLAGTYVLTLTVTDDEGDTASCTVTITAVPPDAIHIELVWDTQYGDADLHLTAPYATPSEAWYTNDDCWFNNDKAAWPPNGPSGNCDLDLDDTDGYGPENINLSVNPADGDYEIGVAYYCSRSLAKNGQPGQTAPGDGPTTATVRIYCAGVLVDEIDKISLDETGRFVDVATLNWPSCNVQQHKQSDWVANVQPAFFSQPVHCLVQCSQDNDCPGPEVCGSIGYCALP